MKKQILVLTLILALAASNAFSFNKETLKDSLNRKVTIVLDNDIEINGKLVDLIEIEEGSKVAVEDKKLSSSDGYNSLLKKDEYTERYKKESTKKTAKVKTYAIIREDNNFNNMELKIDTEYIKFFAVKKW